MTRLALRNGWTIGLVAILLTLLAPGRRRGTAVDQFLQNGIDGFAGLQTPLCVPYTIPAPGSIGYHDTAEHTLELPE